MANQPRPLAERTIELVDNILKSGNGDANARMKSALRTLGKWRTVLIKNQILSEFDCAAIAGPFRGMRLQKISSEGCFVPKLLGSYESSLHPVVERIVASGYDRIIDIGCAEGYYAVGLALRMPAAEILAFDTNEAAQRTCAATAALNGVADRIKIGGLFAGADFAAHPGALVICDIEGAEGELLDPEAYPGLREVDVLVEAHDCFTPGLSGTLANRFAATHRIERFESRTSLEALPPLADSWDELDRLLAVWEWRSGETPWLFMTRPR